MYLVSAYFDEETNNRIQQYINHVAKKTGNTYMPDGNVPPHITISSFDTGEIDKVISLLEQSLSNTKQGKIKWTSVSAFLPYVLYISPVLNHYLQELSEECNRCLQTVERIKISPYYQPFSWMPHTTIGKKLTKEQMQIAFEVMQHQFGPFEGTITKIGIVKTNPYEDIIVLKLPN